MLRCKRVRGWVGETIYSCIQTWGAMLREWLVRVIPPSLCFNFAYFDVVVCRADILNIYYTCIEVYVYLPRATGAPRTGRESVMDGTTIPRKRHPAGKPREYLTKHFTFITTMAKTFIS